MASIRKRGNKWQAQVRKEGHPPIARSFSTRDLALRWARDKEREIERGELPAAVGQLRGRTLGELLRRYRDEVTPSKRGAASEHYRVNRFLSDPVATTPLDRIGPALFAGYRDRRLKVAQPGTVRRELAILQHCLEVARCDWGVPLGTNPLTDVKLPASGKPRDRRLDPQEVAQLLEALQGRRAAYLRPLVPVRH